MAALRYMSGRELAKRGTQRIEQLEWIQQQVACGELVIRQATVEERERYGIAPPGGAGRAGASAGGS
jgi:hypothetical protein